MIASSKKKSKVQDLLGRSSAGHGRKTDDFTAGGGMTGRERSDSENISRSLVKVSSTDAFLILSFILSIQKSGPWPKKPNLTSSRYYGHRKS